MGVKTIFSTSDKATRVLYAHLGSLIIQYVNPQGLTTPNLFLKLYLLDLSIPDYEVEPKSPPYQGASRCPLLTFGLHLPLRREKINHKEPPTLHLLLVLSLGFTYNVVLQFKKIYPAVIQPPPTCCVTGQV